eukprot:1340432-Prymnesium_polylepis.1
MCADAAVRRVHDERTRLQFIRHPELMHKTRHQSAFVCRRQEGVELLVHVLEHVYFTPLNFSAGTPGVIGQLLRVEQIEARCGGDKRVGHLVMACTCVHAHAACT